MNKLKETKGITLVALVITIIILVLLAEISISAITNQGLFTQTLTAQNLIEQKKIEENAKLNEYEISINEYLTGKSKTIEYSIKYDGNGATSGSMENSIHEYGVEKVLSKNTYEREDYIFKGWNTEKDGSGEEYQDVQSVINLCNIDKTNIILYAQWEAKTVYIIKDGIFLQGDPSIYRDPEGKYPEYSSYYSHSAQEKSGYYEIITTGGTIACAGGQVIRTQLSEVSLQDYSKLVIDVYTYTSGSTYYGIDIGLINETKNITLLTRGYNRIGNTINNQRKLYEFNCSDYPDFTDFYINFYTYSCESSAVDKIFVYNVYLTK